MSDKGYEKLVEQIKRLHSPDKLIFIGSMKTENSVSIGELTLTRDDLLKNDRLTNLEAGDTVLILKLNEEKYVIIERVVSL